MNAKLTSILRDLYALDPGLKVHEAELVPVLEALLRAEPDTQFDAAFAAKLRRKLLTPPPSPYRMPTPTMPVFNKLLLIGIGSLATLAIAIPVTYWMSHAGSSFQNLALNDVNTVPTITTLGQEAFGSLTAVNAPAETTAAPVPAPAMGQVSGMGGGGGAPMALDGSSPTKNIAIGEPYPGGNPIEYVYTYSGDPLNLDDISDAVYRQNSGVDLGNLGNDLSRAKIGPLDMNSFHNLGLQSFSYTQSDKNGYSIYVDATNGQLSLNGNEGVWGYTNGDYTPFRDDQVMSNEDLIATADKFLSDHDLDMSAYGAPVVDTRSLVYARRQPASLRYTPEVMTLTYPLLLDGQPAYGEDGSAYGLYVTVNMRTKMVANLNVNIASSYDKSSYELDRDSDDILKLAEQGGLYAYPAQGATDKVTIELGTPKVILINHSTYDGSKTETLFMPALSFPITKNSDTNPVYNDSVVIPLVKSVLDQANQQPIAIPLELK